MADVRKVAVQRVFDGNFPVLRAGELRQRHSVAEGALCGAHAGHAHRQHIRSGAAQLFHGLQRRQEGQGAVQPAGQTDDRPLCAAGGQPPGQAGGLDPGDLGAAAVQLFRVVRHKGQTLRRPPGQEFHLGGGVDEVRRQAHGAVGRRAHAFHIGAVAQPVGPHPLHIHHRPDDAAGSGIKLLGQQPPVFADHAVAAEHQVGGALGVAGAGVNINAVAPGGLAPHQVAAVVALGDRFVAGGGVQDDVRPGEAGKTAGRHRRPQILADLRAQHHAAGAVGHQQVFTERHRNALAVFQRPEHAVGQAGRGGGEPPFFVEFAVVGQAGLGHKAQQPSPADRGGTVVQLAVHRHRQPHQRDEVQPLAGPENTGQPVEGRLLQRLLEKQVPAGVAGQRQLGENRQLDPAGGTLRHLFGDLPGVIGAVRHPQRGREGRRFQKTILHTRHILSNSNHIPRSFALTTALV